MNSGNNRGYNINKSIGEGKKIGIVRALWNSEITNKFYQGCVQTLQKYGVEKKVIETIQVPGSFELIYAGKKLYQNSIKSDRKFDAIILIGSIIKGETPHFNFISEAVANGIKDLNLLFDIPFVFCVSTDLNKEQALDRAGGEMGNKGVDAAYTTLHLLENISLK